MILAIDVGGSSIKCGLFSDDYLVSKFSISTPQTGSQDVIFEINKIIEKAIAEHKISKVGIGFPSVVSKDYFVHIAPNIPNFINVDLQKEICSKFQQIQIKIENDANAAALAELHYGNGIGLNNMIYITLGSGIGGAIIINKSIYYGDTNGAGEIGYSVFKFDENENNIKNRTGIFEEYIARKQITQYFINKYKKNIESPKEMFDLAEQNDADAINTFEYFGKLLGIGIASMMNMLDIQSVIIGGGLARANKYFMKSLLASIDERKLNHIQPNVKIAKYLDDTGIYGAMAILK